MSKVESILFPEVTAYWKRPGYAPASRRRVAFLTPCSGLWPCVTTGFAEDQLLSCMTKRSLCVPTSAYVASYVNALREGYQMGSDPPLNSEAIEAIATDFPAHLVEITRQDRRITFSNGSSGLISPFSLFWFVEGEKEFLGSLYLRHELANDDARLFAGHIRYGIRPSRRNEGLGTEMLIAATTEARALGLSRILLTCGETNIPSRHLIENCGGSFEKAVYGPNDTGLIRRYWISI
jgi:predicted acetyltransferase